MVLPTAISVINGKGGVGKTSITSNLAGLAAASGYQVLLVDLDPQGNAARDLGFRDRSDEGQSLFAAMSMPGRATLEPVEGVRERLDVIPGGAHTEDVADLASAWERQGRQPQLVLYETVAPLAGGYDLLLFDCPPGVRFLQDSALCASRFALVPTRSDESSVDGLSRVASRFGFARRLNPSLELLGVVLFGLGSSARRIREEVRRDIAEGLGEIAPVFSSMIRHAEKPARDCRSLGLLAHEYEAAALGGGQQEAFRFSTAAGGLAADYEQLASEVLGAFAARLAGQPAPVLEVSDGA